MLKLGVRPGTMIHVSLSPLGLKGQCRTNKECRFIFIVVLVATSHLEHYCFRQSKKVSTAHT